MSKTDACQDTTCADYYKAEFDSAARAVILKRRLKTSKDDKDLAMTKESKIGIALGGGSILGAAHIGAHALAFGSDGTGDVWGEHHIG